jgi:hypothetical protein
MLEHAFISLLLGSRIPREYSNAIPSHVRASADPALLKVVFSFDLFEHSLHPFHRLGLLLG